MQAEVDTERSLKEEAERKVAELELQIEKLESDLASAQRVPPSMPGTPRRGGVDGFGTPGRAGSPGVFSPGASRMKGQLSFTQLYSEHSQMKSELEFERRESNKLRATMDEMIQAMESKQPEWEEMNLQDNELKEEVNRISGLLEETIQDRDVAKKEARRWQGEAGGLRKEIDLLRQQLRDHSFQVKVLVLKQQAMEQGLETLSPADDALLNQVIRGHVEAPTDDSSDTARFISQRLVLFHNIDQLQQQNEQLLKVTREIGEQLEGEEAMAKRNQQEQEHRELEFLRQRVQTYKDEVQSLTTQMDSYHKERDIFKRMLTSRGQLPPGSEFGDGSIPGSPPPGSLMQSVEPSSHSKELGEYSRLVKELQGQFEAYRKETAVDRTTLRTQLDEMIKEKSKLHSDLAKADSQREFQVQRSGLIESERDMLKTQASELQKRASGESERYFQLERQYTQLREDEAETKSLADSMRNEVANLKAEKELLKKIEARMSEDNRSLLDEKSRLNKHANDLQSLHNQKELELTETIKRHQNRIDALESDLQTAKRRLDEEVGDGKKAALRREYEQNEQRTRIDDLLKSLNNAKEDLAAAKTQRDTLQARVDEMKIELRAAEERADALQPRPTPRNEGNSQVAQNSPEDAELSREQELALEVSELKRNYDLLRTELQQAKADVEQYRNISQSTEEELANSNETHDQYREETDRSLAEKDSKIKDLEQRVQDISAELT
ncbi:hypothetical protein LTS18_005850, partial [Coniosporium uncinatum]